MKNPIAPATKFQNRYTPTKNMIDFLFTTFEKSSLYGCAFSAVATWRAFSSSQSFDSSNCRCKTQAIMATTTNETNNKRLPNNPKGAKITPSVKIITGPNDHAS